MSPYVCQLFVLLSLSSAVFADDFKIRNVITRCVINIKIITYFWYYACSINNNNNPLKKRQIYREQVLPHAGGKIPDTAFETDRLFLNRLQKEGISVPDGIVPQQRSPQVSAL